MANVAQRLNMSVREIYRLVPLEAKLATKAFAERRKALHAQRAASRVQKLADAVTQVASDLRRREVDPTKRLVGDEIEKCGICLKWAESKPVLQAVRAEVEKLRQLPATPDHSGN
jgi:hypothetical protein